MDRDALARFEIHHGQFFAVYRAKNQNWWLDDKWIGYGDLRDEDIARIQEALKPGETFQAGWKELPPWTKKEDFFGDGGGCWITIRKNGVMFK